MVLIKNFHPLFCLYSVLLNETGVSLNIFGQLAVSNYFCSRNYHMNMKKSILSFMVLIGAVNTQAEDFSYLTFELTDGAKASVSVESLSLSVSGKTLIASSQTFTLANLSKMYFSATDETTTGIDTVESDVLTDGATEIFDMKGRKVSKADMKKGVYIVKTKSRTYKIIVR